MLILMLGFLYPSYKSFKVLIIYDFKMIHSQSYNPAISESLLIHFISLSVFLSIEYVTDILFFWIPFYSSLKLLFVLWLSIPFFGVNICLLMSEGIKNILCGSYSAISSTS